MPYIVQISDTHLFGDKNRKINGSNSYENLKKVINSILFLQEKPEIVVVTGDISQDCTFESYQHMANLLNSCKVEYCILPGNHDNVDILNKVFEYELIKDKADYFLEFKKWLFYIIDTSHYPDDGGELSKDQIVSFENILHQNKNMPTLVFMHHHPVLVNSSWIDKMILKDANEFNKIIKTNPQIKAVLFGHIHQVFEKNVDGTFYGSAPATCYQVVPNTKMFAIEKLTPGYRLIELNENKFSSKIIWL